MTNLSINNNSNYFDSNFKIQPSYIQNQQVRIDCIDTFIKSTNDLEEQRLNGGKWANLTGSTTAGIVSLCSIIIGLGTMFIRSKKNPSATLNEIQKKVLKNKNIKTYITSTLIALASYVGIQTIHNKNIKNDSPELIENFNKYNTKTSAKLSDRHLRSNSLGAQYNIINGKVEINKNYLHDPFGKRKLNGLIKHELEHARQFEMIAAMDDGIEKLNYAFIKNLVSSIKNPEIIDATKELDKILEQDYSGTYDDAKIFVQGAEVNMKKYIKAVTTLFENPNAKYTEIPMVIDQQHYAEAIQKRGPLTEEEQQKAEQYYQAYLDYPKAKGLDLFNPFSKYYKNLLEVEARKAAKK